MDNEKQQLIDYYTKILNAINTDDYRVLDNLAKISVVSNNGKELRQYTRIIKEQGLRRIFNGYIEAITNEKLEDFLKSNKYESEEQLDKDINFYLSNWATDKEKNKYITIRKVLKKTESEDSKSFMYMGEINRLLHFEENDCLECYYESGIAALTVQSWVNKYILINNVPEEEQEKLQKAVEEYKKYRCSQAFKKRKDKSKDWAEQKKYIIDTEIFPSAKELIERLIASNKSKEEYCRLHGINLKDVNNALNIIKQCNEAMYNFYIKHIEKIELDESKYNATLALMMEKRIESGIEEEDYIRNFDIIDYYMITKTNPRYFARSALKSLKSESQIINLRILLAKYYNSSIQEIPFNEELELSLPNSILIDKTPRLITREEKQGFINYLKRNKIPVTDYTYKTMKIRFTNLLTGRNIKRKTYS